MVRESPPVLKRQSPCQGGKITTEGYRTTATRVASDGQLYHPETLRSVFRTKTTGATPAPGLLAHGSPLAKQAANSLKMAAVLLAPAPPTCSRSLGLFSLKNKPHPNHGNTDSGSAPASSRQNRLHGTETDVDGRGRLSARDPHFPSTAFA